MTTQPISADLLGPQAERLTGRERSLLVDVLDRLDDGQLATQTPSGSTVASLLDHLAEGAERFTRAIQQRDQHEGRPLFEALGSDHGDGSGDAAAAKARYRRASEQLTHELGQTRLRDWSWPTWSPHGGMESLAETTRRWVAHHYVHRQDILEATARPLDRDDDTVALVVEYVLDALAREGGAVVPDGVAFEVFTSAPGGGTWTVRFDPPAESSRTDLDIWTEVLGSRPELPRHRVDRGSVDAPRANVRGSGEEVWRAAFGRGATWEQLEVHGDDEGRELWRRLTTTL